jgi:hypothetical protein
MNDFWKMLSVICLVIYVVSKASETIVKVATIKSGKQANKEEKDEEAKK